MKKKDKKSTSRPLAKKWKTSAPVVSQFERWESRSGNYGMAPQGRRGMRGTGGVDRGWNNRFLWW
ncbi:unnamed protein product [Tuber melanosporum]|uniref:(Perigord truffle) hypothetical protein n=1 Tax=Tuber melanosporum (strain Mel28) TaxID=656061 RepID=D5GGX4_TUBMM|nr:uncharacterized protein GSTUM_00007584001 [Tuber melanosporum]CAZ83767.1 unnamed protein product [Tuber melanosporum]